MEWNLFLSPDFCLLRMFALSWVLAVVPALEDHLQDFLPLSRNTNCHLMIYLFVPKYFSSLTCWAGLKIVTCFLLQGYQFCERNVFLFWACFYCFIEWIPLSAQTAVCQPIICLSDPKYTFPSKVRFFFQFYKRTNWTRINTSIWQCSSELICM